MRRGIAEQFTVSSGVLAAAAVVVIGLGMPRAAQPQSLLDGTATYGTPWRFSSGITGTETFSDNIDLRSNDRRSELVTEISPSFSITRSGPRLNVAFSYAPDYLYYARKTTGAQLRNSLSANLNASLIENLLSFNASANIAQANISPFGTQAANTVNASNNRVESRSYSFGPTLHSRLDRDITYSIAYQYSVANSDSSALAGSHSTSLVANAQTSTSFRDVGLGVSYDRTQQFFGGVNTILVEQASSTVTYVLLPTMHVSATGGYDRDSYPATGQPQTKGSSYSGGFDWRPSHHTTFSAQFGHSYFGPTANVQLSESLPSASITGIYSRGRSTSAGNGLTQVANPNYQLLDQYYRTTITDPVLRGQAVTTALQQAGLGTSQYATSPFVSNQLSVQTVAALSVALFGVRNTATFDVSRMQSQQLSNLSVGFDIFDQASRFQTTSYTANFSHRTSSDMSFNATVQKSDSRALEGTGATTQKTFVVSASRTLSRKVSATAMYRYVNQKGTDSIGGFYNGNYHENAVIGSLRLNF